MTTKITDGITRITRQQRPIVTDFDGNDAMLKDPVQLRQQVQDFAVGSLPQVVRKVFKIIQDGKSPKDVIEAAKFLKQVADGNIPKQKVIDGLARKLSTDELNTKLNGVDEE